MTAQRILIAAEWTAATTLAVLGAQLAAEIAGLFGGYLILVLVPVLPIAAGGLAGIAIGGLQWFALRRHAADSESWIVFTIIGCVGVACVSASAVFVPSLDAHPYRLLGVLVAGTPILGWCQSKAVRHWTPHTLPWIVASTIAWERLHGDRSAVARRAPVCHRSLEPAAERDRRLR